jgi:cytochrome oxidase assembly protein ShyY1
VTPLVLADGTSVLVDRGWVPAAAGGFSEAPAVPVPPPGEVTVVGRVRQPESGARPPDDFAGRPSVRRIAPERIAPELPYPLYGAYLTLESQTPAADPGFVTIGPQYENAAMNAGYVVQWWVFAALTLAGLGYLVVREGRTRTAGPASPSSGAIAENAPENEGTRP